MIGRREGLQEGVQEGARAGRRAALIELTLALLDDRGVAVDAASEAQIRECEDVAQLQRWARRAAQATEVTGIFERSGARSRARSGARSRAKPKP